MIVKCLRLLLVPGIAMLMSACTLFDGGDAEPTPETNATVVASPAAAAPVPSPTPEVLKAGDSVPMTWHQVMLPDPGDEPARPFQRRVAEMEGDGEDLWRVYVATDEGEPQLVYESRRWVTGADWTDGGEALVISEWTAIEEALDEALTLLPNAQKLIPGESEPVWEVRLPGSWFGWQTLGGFAIVSQRSGDAPLLLMSDGTAWMPRVQGQQVQLSGVSPNGRFVSVRSLDEYSPQTLQSRNANLNFIAEPLGDAATLAGIAREALFSPAATHVALFDSDRLATFEVETGLTRELALPVGVPLGAPKSWSAGGEYLLVNDGIADALTLTWLLQPTERQVIGAGVSVSLSTLALTLDIFGEEPLCDEPGLHNKTILVDLASGNEETLFGCDRFFTRIQWLGDEGFLTYTHTCWACEAASLPFFVTIDGAMAKPLAEDFSYWAGHDIAHDGPARILVAGPQLRLYWPDGTLLRSISVDEGYEVTRAAWKPDASAFVYIVGPKDFVII